MWWAHAAPLLVVLLLVAVELAVSRFDAKSIRAACPVAELDAGAKGRLDAALLEAA